MRSSTVKATRRDIRKAFGPDALELTTALAEHTRTLEALVDAERTHRLDLAKEQRAYVDQADTQLMRRLTALERIVRLGFFGRLRWLLTGATP